MTQESLLSADYAKDDRRTDSLIRRSRDSTKLDQTPSDYTRWPFLRQACRLAQFDSGLPVRGSQNGSSSVAALCRAHQNCHQLFFLFSVWMPGSNLPSSSSRE